MAGGDGEEGPCPRKQTLPHDRDMGVFSEADLAIPPFLPQQLWTAAPAHGSECKYNTQAPKEVTARKRIQDKHSV